MSKANRKANSSCVIPSVVDVAALAASIVGELNYQQIVVLFERVNQLAASDDVTTPLYQHLKPIVAKEDPESL